MVRDMTSTMSQGISAILALTSVFMSGGLMHRGLMQIGTDSNPFGIILTSIMGMMAGGYYLFYRIIRAERALQDGV